MNHSGVSLGEFFRACRDRGEPLVLATVTRTLGSTYRKAGAQMLIAGDGRAAGLLSGGCLEADLMERARAVLAGPPVVVDYDTRSSDDLIWGIGLGCEGAMTILLSRLDRANDYQPFAFIEDCRRRGVAGNFAVVAQSTHPAYPLGAAFRSNSAVALPAGVADVLQATATLRAATTVDTAGATFLIVPVELPPRLLVLGAGPDAMPLVEIAGLMNWHVTVLDHRPAYAVAERFPRAQRVALNPAGELAAGAARCALRRSDRDEPSPAVGPGVSRCARRTRRDSLRRTARTRAAARATDAGNRRAVAASAGTACTDRSVSTSARRRRRRSRWRSSARFRPCWRAARADRSDSDRERAQRACPSTRTPRWRSPARSAARPARRGRRVPRRSA